ncbi:hypothetical protein ACW73L_16265 [Methylolobus aquaticus]
MDIRNILFLGLVMMSSCVVHDPELDKQIDRYRGTGIQQQGNTLPPHEVEDLED